MMKTKTTNESLELVVPTALKALCVGEKDEQDEQKSTSTFAGATTDSTSQTTDRGAFLGDNVVRRLSDAPLHPHTLGITRSIYPW